MLASTGSIPPVPPAREAPDFVDALRKTVPALPTDVEIAGSHRSVTHHRIRSDDGKSIPLLVCAPVAMATPAPVLFWIHGGGMIAGDHRIGLAPVIALADDHAAIVVSVGYRMAPEHSGLTPVRDCLAALMWVGDHAHRIGADPSRVVVAGASAGGGLAAGTALLARERHAARPMGLMLFAPMLDDRNDSASATRLGAHATWDAYANEAAWAALLGSTRGTAEVSPFCAPARATDLRAFPPTFIDVGSTDLFRSEDVAFAEALWTAGVDAELHVWPGGFHGYDTFAPSSRISRETRRARRDWLGRLLGDDTWSARGSGS